MSATLTNGARKTLADQINRLDSLLDGLSVAIPEVIADSVREAVTVAVREAVRDAVQHVLSEVLTSPVVLDRLREAASQSPAVPEMDAAPVPVSVRPGPLTRLRQWTAAIPVRCAQARAAMTQRLQLARAWMGEKVELVRRWGKSVLVALGLSSSIALLAYLAGPLTGSAICALSVFTLVLIASVQARKTDSPSAS